MMYGRFDLERIYGNETHGPGEPWPDHAAVRRAVRERGCESWDLEVVTEHVMAQAEALYADSLLTA